MDSDVDEKRKIAMTMGECGVFICWGKKFIRFSCVSKLAIKAKHFILINYYVAHPRKAFGDFLAGNKLWEYSFLFNNFE